MPTSNATNHVIVFRTCPFCKKEQRKEYPIEGYARFMQGAHVQDCFPDMTPDDREFLITGICPTCWDLTFGGDD